MIARNTAAASDSLPDILARSPAIDQVGVEERVERLQKRSIKKESKVHALKLALSMIDLTTLEGADSPGKVKQMCYKAAHLHDTLPGVPTVAAVCVYPTLVRLAKKELGESGIKVAAVATGFPSGQFPLNVKLDDTRFAVGEGADEIDMVISRGHFLAGGDFIKTSTGKVAPAATLPVTLLMLEVVRDWHLATGQRIGVKPAGGIRSSKDAIKYLVTVAETAGEEWLRPHLFRFGASSLLNDVLLQRQKLATGHYSGADYVTID